MRGGLEGAAPAVVERWYVLLQPWREYLSLVDHVFNEFSYISVNIGTEPMPRPLRENVWRCRETLELLMLIALVESAADEPPSSIPSTTRHVVINGYNTRTSALLSCGEVYGAFFFAFDESSQRDEFRDAMMEIFSYLPVAKRRKVASKWKIQVSFFMTTTREGQSLSITYFTSALELVKGMRRRASEAVNTQSVALEEAGGLQWRYRFPYINASVELVMSSSTPELGTAPLLAELIARGVHIKGAVNIGSKSALGRFPVSELGPVFHATTNAASMCASEGYERAFRWERNVLWLHDWDITSSYRARCLQAVCSSLAVYKNLKELCVSGFDDDNSMPHKSRWKVLQWLMYALFSHESACCFTSLTFTKLSVNDDEVTGVLDMFTAKHPAQKLLDGGYLQDDDLTDQVGGGVGSEDEDGGDHDEFAVVKAGSTLSIAPTDPADLEIRSALESFVLKQDARFRVLRNDPRSDWVDMIVPHYGYCIVSRASVNRFEPGIMAANVASRSYTGSLTSLTLIKCSHTTLLPLLKYVGPKLLSLSVSDNVGEQFLLEALTACPHLTSLRVTKPEERIEYALIYAYEKGGCKLESVCITEYKQGREESLLAFFLMLQDLTSHAAKTLRHLETQCAIDHLFPEGVFRALAQMLQVNCTIEHMRIYMCESLVRAHLKALMATDGLPVVPRPLGLKSRFALLSVLKHLRPGQATLEPPRSKRARHSHSEQGDETKRLGGVDRWLVSSIFAFAAERVVRHVHIDIVSMDY